ncbi:MAG: Peroxiredoxin [Saliniramus fredricksonii]|uniref:Peroxiredoxin n=1 Tax=Saliniramus fredricksonii TaxID=1653334 RepID=A0A0P7YB12_9HYPH|nr:peroxiredoxin [Saliniramus fredricksonii]KPQ11225.1 MAG: Peroxiredoxin [Saliniramus fredricksonii]SCC81757.1 Peroxiredoxin [Saliniramus fredricksonii]
MNQPNLQSVDWSAISAPEDDGAAAHLTGARMPDITLPATDGSEVALGRLNGWSVLFFYPMTGRPDQPLPDGWDQIPGARGCTPQSCAFRDLSRDLADCGVSSLYGISTQTTAYQREAAERLHLPFPLLSDADLALAEALSLPTLQVEGMVLIKRLTLILRDDRIEKVFYPVFPPDRNAGDVLAYLRAQ